MQLLGNSVKLIGNTDIQTQLTLSRFSALQDKRPLPHTLLSGAAGCGKTSTARKIAEESGCMLFTVAAESVRTRDDVVDITKQFSRDGYDRYGNRIREIPVAYPILFIDEIHRIPGTGQEHLGIAMEEWRIAVDSSQVKAKPYDQFGMATKDRSRWCPQFTLIGATTNDGLLSKPFKDRFKLRFPFNTYTLDESVEIAKVHADRIGIKLEDGGAREIAARGRGVPRIIVGLLERCRDLAVSLHSNVIDTEVAKVSFGIMKMDNTGLTQTDIKILTALYEAKDPLGVDNLSILVNESKQGIAETIEPYLIQKGFITRTSRGRILTKQGKEYLIMAGHIVENDEEDWVDIPNDYVRRL